MSSPSPIIVETPLVRRRRKAAESLRELPWRHRLLTDEEVCLIMGKSRATVWRMRKAGLLPPKDRFGRTNGEALDAALKSAPVEGGR